MKCLMKYQWVKLPRNHLPEGKGIMNAWAKLASRAAFRKGQASYCGHINAVSPGMWSGGVVGLKSILGSRSRVKSLEALSKLSELGYISYSLNAKTKKLTYQITDWVIKCSGEECMDGTVYATEGYGFLCLPRNITDRLVEQQYIFDEADAWLDLWCHTVSEDPDNAFSFLAPIAQFGKFGAVLTLETLGQRWNWEKTKVWRFFQKHGDVFTLHRLPGAFGCLIFNKLYPTDAEVSIPESEKIERIIAEIRILAKNKQKVGSDQENLSRLVALYSRQLLTECAEEDENTMAQNRVALFDPYILRAYFSHSNCKKCIYDCKGKSLYYPPVIDTSKIRGLCAPVNITKIAKEMFTYPDIRLILVLPCFSQTRGWSQEDIEIYDDIKQKADKVVYTSQEYTRGCMHKRNRHLVDNSSACISYLTENKGGTFYTVNYAKSKGVEVINIAE